MRKVVDKIIITAAATVIACGLVECGNTGTAPATKTEVQTINNAITESEESSEITDHESQQCAIRSGTYETTITEEFDGQIDTYTYSLELNPDYTGVMYEQDMIGCYWTPTEIVDKIGNRYEYRMEGDTLRLNRFDDVWDTYVKISNETAKTIATAERERSAFGKDSDRIIAAAAGTYRDIDGDELIFAGDGSVTVDINCLTHMEGNVSGFKDKYTFLMTVKDYINGDMELSFNTATGDLLVEKTNQGLLEKGTEFTLVKERAMRRLYSI